MSKEYFSHDIDALSDIKIVKMMQDYDYAGFGWYWAIVAEIYKNGGKYNFEDLSILSKATGIDVKELEIFINNCIKKYTHNNKGLFISDENCFWSVSLQKRMEIREKRANARKIIAAERVDIEGADLVNLTAEEVEKLKAKYGDDTTYAAIYELQKWLEMGKVKLSSAAKNAIGKPHYYYFRNDGWLLNKVRENVKKSGANWSI